VTVTDAAVSLGLSRRTVVNQVRAGRIRARKHGPIYWISPGEVERYRRESLGRKGRPPLPPPPQGA
jgi:excisionase family DNA binding protein